MSNEIENGTGVMTKEEWIKYLADIDPDGAAAAILDGEESENPPVADKPLSTHSLIEIPD